ncbi:MAG: response regulator transcription factor [Anaerolineae bacterium]|nr:response regulator transcription factor [Anaerolineae bacterium]
MTRVLIVDDQLDFRRHLSRLLACAGLTVVGEAGDILEAESLVQSLQPDLAVVDVMLPGISGVEGTPRLKAVAPALRVILISAHRNQAHLFCVAGEQAGAEAYVAKDDLDLELARTWREEGGEVDRKRL